MKLLGRKKTQDESADDAAVAPAAADGAAAAGATQPVTRTGPKGRPTPKRGAARGVAKKGPIAPAPQTAAEARARRKTLQGPKLSREERKEQRVANRSRMTDRRERMMAGDEAYLLPRDQGPVRRYVRDVVDSRRNLLGLFMPATLTLLFMTFGVPQLQLYLSPAMLLIVAIMGVDGLFLGRKVNRLVDAKFPSNTESHWKIGLYAAQRASQMRRMRTPRAQVQHGTSVE